MTLMIRNYHDVPRLLQVRVDQPTEATPEHETLYLNQYRLELAPSGFTTDLDERDARLMENLHDGDIATLNDKGILSVLYEGGSGDVTIYMTGRCNSNCIMCPESDNQRHYDESLAPNEMMEFLDMLPSSVWHFTITGGEPTLNTDLFFEVMAKLREKYNGREILLLTNGRSFAAKSMIERMTACLPSRLTAAIPIHGHTAELHDRISRAKGSFRQTCLGVRNLRTMGSSIELRVVVSRLNHKYMREIAAFIVEEFPYVDIVNFVGLEAMGNCAKYLDEVYIDYIDAFPYIKPAVEILMAAGIDTALYNFPLCAVESGFWPICRQSISPYKVRFAESCYSCDAHSQCGGVFFSTLSAAKPKLAPIHFRV